MADGLNDLKKHVMRVFEDATKDCVDMELKEQFDIMIGDYDSLNQYALGMFDSMVRHDMVDQGRELFRPVTVPGTLPDVAVYTIVILVYAHAGKIRDALKVYHHMLSTAVAPTAYTYTVLITAIGRDSSGADFVGHAKKFFLEMLDRGMKPRSETYMVVLDLVAYREPAEKAKEFLEQIEATGRLSPGSKAYQLKEDKKEQFHKRLKEEVKKTDKQDKEKDRQRRREKRMKKKMKLKRANAEEEDDDVSESEEEPSDNRSHKRSKIYFDSDDDGEREEKKDKAGFVADSSYIEHQQALALKLLDSMHN